MRFVKPLDGELLRDLAARFTRVVTVEDNTVLGGFGSAVAEFLATRGSPASGSGRSASPTGSSTTAHRRNCTRSSGSTRRGSRLPSLALSLNLHAVST